MTNEDVKRAQQRIADMRDVRRQDLRAAAPRPGGAAADEGAPFRVGDRILDLRSGQEGAVVYVGQPDRKGDVLVSIRCDDGSTFVRGPGDLLARPRPPASRS